MCFFSPGWTQEIPTLETPRCEKDSIGISGRRFMAFPPATCVFCVFFPRFFGWKMIPITEFCEEFCFWKNVNCCKMIPITEFCEEFCFWKICALLKNDSNHRILWGIFVSKKSDKMTFECTSWLIYHQDCKVPYIIQQIIRVNWSLSMWCLACVLFPSWSLTQWLIHFSSTLLKAKPLTCKKFIITSTGYDS